MEQSGGIQASLSGRYASALFQLARDDGTLGAVEESLGGVKQALAESADLRALASSPVIGRDVAGKTIGAVAASMGLDPLTANFLGVLAANRRLGSLAAIIRDFKQLAARHRGEVSAEIVSAHPLDDGQVASLKTRLKNMVGSEVAVDLKIDPSILGGLIVRLGSRQIDGSIRTKLNTLAHAMRG